MRVRLIYVLVLNEHCLIDSRSALVSRLVSKAKYRKVFRKCIQHSELGWQSWLLFLSFDKL